MATPTPLPATFVAGNVLTAAQMNGLRGAFRIMQIVSATTSTEQSSSTSTYADATGLSVSITPQSTSSKILLAYMTLATKNANSGDNEVKIQFVRNATSVAAWINVGYTATLLNQFLPFTGLWIDSPNTTSATTYKVQFANGRNGALVAIQANNNPGTFVAMEISA
jgi:hypothetical protein